LDRNNVEGWFEAGAGSCGIIKVLSRINLTGASLTDGETEIVENENGEKESLGRQRLVDLTTLCSVPWALGDYYIDGPL
jgi:hypothetical protein